MYLDNLTNIGDYNRYSGYTGFGTSNADGTNGLPYGNSKTDGTNGTPYGVTDKEQDKEDYESGKKECQTCKNRKYQDGSNEMVSYKAAAHISPESAGSAVRAHEQEHVSNAYKKAATGDGEVISASVSIHTAICPECGRSYVSGGTTNTQIKYVNEDNKYQQELKSQDEGRLKGMFFDAAV